MGKKPMIGVLPLWDETRQSLWMLPGYLEGILQAGGLPVVLPLTGEVDARQLAEACDGFLFTGGQDVQPALYGQEDDGLCGEMCPARDTLEAALFHRAVVELDKPALGICRGVQIMNVLLGGTLYQDLGAQHPESTGVIHRQSPPHSQSAHTVSVLDNTPLQQMIGASVIQVNSFHHQAVDALASGFEAMAFSPDGLVEAAWMPAKPFVMGVQWHPEFRLGSPDSKALFGAFVDACRPGARTGFFMDAELP